jgi:hypothetical protein
MTYRTKRILETALYSATLIIMVFTFYLRLSNTRTLEILGKTYRTDLVDAAIWTPLAVIFAIKWVREKKTFWALLFVAIAVWKGMRLFKGT